MTPQQQAQSLLAAGLSRYAIAKRLGQPIHRVHRWTAPTPDADTARLLEDANGTRTVPELAERWGCSETDVLRELARLRALGHEALASKRNRKTEQALEKYRHLALDIRPDSTVPELAALWGITRNAASGLMVQMRKAGLDIPRLSMAPHNRPEAPRLWLADCDGTRTIADLAALWGLSYDSAFARIAKARTDGGVTVRVKAAERPKPPGRPKKATEPTPNYAADVTPGRTADDLAAMWGVTLAGAIGRCTHLHRTGQIAAMPSKASRVAPPPKPPRQPKPAAAPNPIADYGVWMAALDGTRTALQVCEAWGVTYDTFIRRIRRLRDAGLYPEWVTPPRERKERKRPAPLPPLWPVGSSPAVEPAPIEEPEHPKPAPYVGLALPPSRWSAVGVCSVLGTTWAVFDVAVQAAFGWTLRPETLLEDADAAAILSTFGVAVRSAA
jgi:biotin operon repressor